jgi:hypothetical protein
MAHCSRELIARSTAWQSCRCRFRITVRRPVILAEVFIVFLDRYRQILAQYVKTGHDHFLSDPAQLIVHKIIVPFNTVTHFNGIRAKEHNSVLKYIRSITTITIHKMFYFTTNFHLEAFKNEAPYQNL